MHNTYKFGFIATVFLALLGCSKSDRSSQPVVIAPGQFVLDEPSKLTGSKIQSSKRCSADTLNGQARSQKDRTWEIKRGEPVILKGWAAGLDDKQPYPEVFLRLTGAAQTYYALTTSRHMRPDATHFLQIDSARPIGFELTAKTEQIEPGIYEMMIMQRGAGDIEGCDTDALLIVN